MTTLILTVIGPDRPGLVEELAAAVASHDGNWLESRMALLGGEFAGIVRIEVKADKVEEVGAALADLDGLNVAVRESATATTPASSNSVDLELIGSDRTGIISEITGALAANGVNVENLDTERVSAPMSGELLFKATARLGLPQGLDTAELQASLEQLAADLMVDISIVDAD